MTTVHVTNQIHRSPLRRALLLIAPALVIIAALTAVPARATPSCGVNTVILALGHYPSGLLDLVCRDLVRNWDLKIKVKGDSDVYIVQSTFPPGTHTGWHTHPGPSLITVTSGELTVYEAADPTCTPHVYHTGESFTDIGCGDVHLVRNEGSVDGRRGRLRGPDCSGGRTETDRYGGPR